MQQASRIATIALFVLMQFFAPLVHAHAGGGPLSGDIHVPGLEFLDAAHDGKSAQTFTYKAFTGTLVGVATGLRHQGDGANASLDTAFALPSSLFFATVLPVDIGHHCTVFDFASPRLFWLSLPPRAPPQHYG